MPFGVTDSSCDVGNPFSLGVPEPGQTILDLGCGAGFDTLFAAKKMSRNGKVIGIDMTPEMVARSCGIASLSSPEQDLGSLDVRDPSGL